MSKVHYYRIIQGSYDEQDDYQYSSTKQYSDVEFKNILGECRDAVLEHWPGFDFEYGGLNVVPLLAVLRKYSIFPIGCEQSAHIDW